MFSVQMNGEQLMAKAKAYVDKNYGKQISLDEVASDLKVSTFYLSHIFSTESDFSLFSYLTNLRMQKARKLLIKGELNVSEVAYAVGYNDGNYFSKIFKKHFGYPPTDLYNFAWPSLVEQ